MDSSSKPPTAPCQEDRSRVIAGVWSMQGLVFGRATGRPGEGAVGPSGDGWGGFQGPVPHAVSRGDRGLATSGVLADFGFIESTYIWDF